MTIGASSRRRGADARPAGGRGGGAWMVALTGALLVAAAAPVPAGKLSTWFPKSGPLTLRAGGVALTIASAPCRGAKESGACEADEPNNQALVTVAAVGSAPVLLLTNDQASYYHVAITRIDRRDRRPGVIVVDDSGGSAGVTWVHVLVPDAHGWRRVDLSRHGSDRLRNVAEEVPVDLSGDGRVDVVVEDGFAVTNGCNACTPRPPAVLTIRDGKSVDISADPRVRNVFVRDMARLRPRCFSKDADRNGACAAYVADAARAGRFAAAWAAMLRHYDRADRHWINPASGPPYTSFPDALRAGLRRAGYLPA